MSNVTELRVGRAFPVLACVLPAAPAHKTLKQHKRLESKGNPRLDNLELIAQALNSELMLIPKDKLGAVIAVLNEEASGKTDDPTKEDGNKSLSDNPWKGLLGDD